MIENIRYNKGSDTLIFDTNELGECSIDEDGDFVIESTDTYISIEFMREIIKLYDTRKEI